MYGDARAFNGNGTMEDVEILFHKLTSLPISDYDHRKCMRFVDNLLKGRKEWLFQLMINPDVEPTNNRAERSLWPSVIHRKTSGGTRTGRC